MSQVPIIAGDLDAFFNEFAQAITDGVTPFDAIIRESGDLLLGGEVGIEGDDIVLICKTADVAAFDHGDVLTVVDTSEDFIIIPPTMPDNTGITRLKLARA